MNWIDVALLVGLVAGFGCFFLLVVRHHPEWVFIRDMILKTALPAIIAYAVKRNTPEVETEMHQATRRAQEWDNFNKRPKDK